MFQAFFILSVFFTLPINSQAKISNCKNPVELNLKEGISMRFCQIPAKNGVPIGSADPEGYDWEKPVVKRNFSKSFHIGQFEVTQEQWIAIMNSRPWQKDDDIKEGPNYPASYISFEQAKMFTYILSTYIDPTATYRLPTEAEWEYAARAGTFPWDYYWDEKFSDNFAYYYGNSAEEIGHPSKVTTCPARVIDKMFPGYCANNFGLMHMSGNVSEYVLDNYVDSYKDAPVDGHQPVIVPGAKHISRGGGYITPRRSMRISRRDQSSSYSNTSYDGFRVIKMR